MRDASVYALFLFRIPWVNDTSYLLMITVDYTHIHSDLDTQNYLLSLQENNKNILEVLQI